MSKIPIYRILKPTADDAQFAAAVSDMKRRLRELQEYKEAENVRGQIAEAIYTALQASGGKEQFNGDSGDQVSD